MRFKLEEMGEITFTDTKETQTLVTTNTLKNNFQFGRLLDFLNHAKTVEELSKFSETQLTGFLTSLTPFIQATLIKKFITELPMLASLLFFIESISSKCQALTAQQKTALSEWPLEIISSKKNLIVDRLQNGSPAALQLKTFKKYYALIFKPFLTKNPDRKKDAFILFSKTISLYLKNKTLSNFNDLLFCFNALTELFFSKEPNIQLIEKALLEQTALLSNLLIHLKNRGISFPVSHYADYSELNRLIKIIETYYPVLKEKIGDFIDKSLRLAPAINTFHQATQTIPTLEAYCQFMLSNLALIHKMAKEDLCILLLCLGQFLKKEYPEKLDETCKIVLEPVFTELRPVFETASPHFSIVYNLVKKDFGFGVCCELFAKIMQVPVHTYFKTISQLNLLTRSTEPKFRSDFILNMLCAPEYWGVKQVNTPEAPLKPKETLLVFFHNVEKIIDLFEVGCQELQRILFEAPLFLTTLHYYFAHNPEISITEDERIFFQAWFNERHHETLLSLCKIDEKFNHYLTQHVTDSVSSTTPPSDLMRLRLFPLQRNIEASKLTLPDPISPLVEFKLNNLPLEAKTIFMQTILTVINDNLCLSIALNQQEGAAKTAESISRWFNAFSKKADKPNERESALQKVLKSVLPENLCVPITNALIQHFFTAGTLCSIFDETLNQLDRPGAALHGKLMHPCDSEKTLMALICCLNTATRQMSKDDTSIEYEEEEENDDNQPNPDLDRRRTVYKLTSF